MTLKEIYDFLLAAGIPEVPGLQDEFNSNYGQRFWYILASYRNPTDNNIHPQKDLGLITNEHAEHLITMAALKWFVGDNRWIKVHPNRCLATDKNTPTYAVRSHTHEGPTILDAIVASVKDNPRSWQR